MEHQSICLSALRERLQSEGKLSLFVHGESMLPTLSDGQQIMIRSADVIKIGDIIAYCFPGTDTNKIINIIVHRVIFVRSAYVLTKGDNNDFVDPLRVKIKDIIGIVAE